ncbi:MAG: ATP-binding cassette domain-containing protein [Thermomicrobiales bacterium]|nr:ATP-binding cassette domain-containing protein [Thermomicrobiales bacterium]
MSQLSKRFGHVSALNSVSLRVFPGETYGFLGPNGAGKTTTIRLLLGFIRPSGGTCAIFGHDCWSDGVAARRHLGFLVSSSTLYPDLTGTAYLDYAATLAQRAPTLQPLLLDALELDPATLDRKIGGYSKGMSQKLALVGCMQTAPRLLIMDEPTDGLDPLMQRAFEQLIVRLRERGTTIFMSSHDLAEVERVCERVAIIRAGHIVTEAAIAELTARQPRVIQVTFAGPAPDWPTSASIRIQERAGSRLVLSVRGDTRPVLAHLAARDDVVDVLVARPTLEQIFHEFYAPVGDQAREPL